MTTDIDPVALVMVGLGGTIISDVTETVQSVGSEATNPVVPASGELRAEQCHETQPIADVISDTTPDPFAVPLDERLRTDITRAIIDYARNMPRTLQKAIGPSDVGHPCARHLAYKLLEVEPVPIQGNDVFPSFVGTAAHREMDIVFGDPKHGGRWIVNQELVAWDGPGGKGHGDAYDTLTHTVVDWKFKGTEAMRDVRKGIISDQYRMQLHVYGLGWENAGYPVEYVCDAFFSRGGNLEGRYGLHPHVEPYDRNIALAAKARLGKIITAAAILQLDTTPANWPEIPATPIDCHFCPWLRLGSTDLSVACPGDSATTTKENAA